jgi:uncharacterized membrane protein
MIEPSFWPKLHGAATHFPIALVLVSTLCDGAAFIEKDGAVRDRFRFAGTLTIILGALGSYVAVFTGLVMTKGLIWGHDALLHHHQFVWPAFALMTGLATWRAMSPAEPSPKSAAILLALMILTSVLVSGAGYWGGELLTGG